MGKMLGGEEKEEDPDAAKKEEERQEALRQQEEERKAKYAKMEAERESMRQGIRDKVKTPSPGVNPHNHTYCQRMIVVLIVSYLSVGSSAGQGRFLYVREILVISSQTCGCGGNGCSALYFTAEEETPVGGWGRSEGNIVNQQDENQCAHAHTHTSFLLK